MPRRSGIQGVNRLRRVMRRVEPGARQIVADELDTVSRAVEADMIAGAPVDDGDLVAEIGRKSGRDGLTVVIGPGARHVPITRSVAGLFGATATTRWDTVAGHALYQFFKAYWIEYGTKGYPPRNVPAQPARPFIGPAWDANSQWARSRVQGAIREALRRASGP